MSEYSLTASHRPADLCQLAVFHFVLNPELEITVLVGMATVILPPRVNVDVYVPKAPAPAQNVHRVNWNELERIAQFERTAYLQALIADSLAQR